MRREAADEDDEIFEALNHYSLFTTPWRDHRRVFGFSGWQTAHPRDGMPVPLFGLGEAWSLELLLPILIAEDDSHDLHKETGEWAARSIEPGSWTKDSRDALAGWAAETSASAT